MSARHRWGLALQRLIPAAVLEMGRLEVEQGARVLGSAEKKFPGGVQALHDFLRPERQRRKTSCERFAIVWIARVGRASAAGGIGK